MNETLFEELAKGRNSDFSFHIGAVTFTSENEKERMREARKLEEDGIIVLSRCDINDMLANAPMVTIAGKFTEKGKALIKAKEIQATNL